MSYNKKHSPITLVMIGLLSYALSGLGFHAGINAGAGVPPLAELVEVSGSIPTGGETVLIRKNFTEFTVEPDIVTIRFPSKAGPHRSIGQELRRNSSNVTAFVNSEQLVAFGSGLRGSVYAYQIEIDGTMLQSYDQVLANWVRNDEVGWSIGIGFLLSGSLLIGLGVTGRRGSQPSS